MGSPQGGGTPELVGTPPMKPCTPPAKHNLVTSSPEGLLGGQALRKMEGK